MSTITEVKSCATTSCTYNNNGCAAYAVTVGDGNGTCTTFVKLDVRGGLPTLNSKVGACQLLECVHNSDLMCTAKAVEFDANAKCLSYEAR
ncbi:DUF1540 domain-containing protein [Tessaracoccus sp. OH4464_COT-324]|nr:DUF1540 domain-containing protein [Tessaracoccus sp. OH4464_COT-324]